MRANRWVDRCSSRSLMARRCWVLQLCVYFCFYFHTNLHPWPTAWMHRKHFYFFQNGNTCVNFCPLSCITPQEERGETTCGALNELVPTLQQENFLPLNIFLESYPGASLLGNKTPVLCREVLQRLCECCSPSFDSNPDHKFGRSPLFASLRVNWARGVGFCTLTVPPPWKQRQTLDAWVGFLGRQVSKASPSCVSRTADAYLSLQPRKGLSATLWHQGTLPSPSLPPSPVRPNHRALSPTTPRPMLRPQIWTASGP